MEPTTKLKIIVYFERVLLMMLLSFNCLFMNLILRDEGRHSDTSPNSSDSGVLSVVLRPRSVLFFSDAVYSHYMHGIEAVSGRLPPLRAQGQLHDVYTVYVYDLKNEHLEALPKREK
jgi:hypothetical protein